MHEELLSELSSAGRRDSSGAFTVDLKRLLPTLARFQLPSKDRIILRLLACAVSSGAGYFEYRPAAAGYQCLWDAVWPAEDLDRLFEFISSDRADRSELAVAVNAALVLGPGWRCRRAAWGSSRARRSPGIKPRRMQLVRLDSRAGQDLGRRAFSRARALMCVVPRPARQRQVADLCQGWLVALQHNVATL